MPGNSAENSTSSGFFPALKKIGSAIWRAIPGLFMMASRAGATYFVIREVNNYVHGQDVDILSTPEAMLCLVLAETGVMTTTFVGRFIVMCRRSRNSNALIINTENVDITTPARVSWCRQFFNPESLNTTSYQMGFVTIQILTGVFTGQVILHSALSADSYWSGNNIPANICFLLFCWANIKGLRKYAFPQNEVFYRYIVLEKHYEKLTFGQYINSIVSALIFGATVAFGVDPSIKAFERNTLATATTQTADVNTTFCITGLLTLAGFVNSLIQSLSSYDREKHSDNARLNGPLDKFIKFGIFLNASYFGVNGYNSLATLPSTIKHEKYFKLNYHPGVIAGAAIGGAFYMTVTVVTELRGYSYMMEQFRENKPRPVNSASLTSDVQSTSESVITVSSNRHSQFSHQPEASEALLAEASNLSSRAAFTRDPVALEL